MAWPTASPRAQPTEAEAAAHAVGRLRAVAREHAVRGLELGVVTSFAVAQPILDVLGRTPEFFAVRGWSRGDVALLAISLTLMLPAALAALEVLVRLTVGSTAALALHLLLLAGLLGLFWLQLLKPTAIGPGTAALVVAGAAGVAAAWVCVRSRAARTLLTVLSPAPLLFLGLFLFHSQAARLVFPERHARIEIVAAASETPVVVILFDELTSTSLLDAEGSIDARRFPSFAALARTSTWYPDATTVSQGTVRAVPALATGRYARPDSLPTVQDHPQNVFTLLGRSHSVHAFEPVTRLCPPAVCPRRDRPSARDALSSLVSDLGVVYLHLVLPDDLARELPPVTRAWGNFRGKHKARTFEERLFWEPTWAFGRFLASLEPQRGRPPFHFAHVNLPHVPYRYLPAGGEYRAPLPGLEDERWTRDSWPAIQAHQRYLLQLGYVDRLLGIALARLRAAGLFDRAVLVVTADHGVSFRPGRPRRAVDATNHADIAFVPLFVKAPGQRSGLVQRGLVRSIDVLPTVAELAGMVIPWRTDGRPLGAHRRRSGGVRIERFEFALAAAFGARARALAAQRRLFGTGEWSRVFRVGPHSELIGRPLSSLAVRHGDDLRALLDSEQFARAGASFVAGRLSSESGAPAQAGLALAVAVNGTIAAVCQSYSDGGETRFSALVPGPAFRDGRNRRNRVDVLAVSSAGSRLRLTRLGPGTFGSRGG